MSFLLNAIGEAADKLADAATSALEIPEAGDDEILQVLNLLRHPVRWPSGISELHARVETYPHTVAVLVGSNEPRHIAILGSTLARLVRLASPVDAQFLEENPWARVASRFAEDEGLRLRLQSDLLRILHQVVAKISNDRKDDRAYWFEVLAHECGDALLQLMDVSLLKFLVTHML